MTTPATPSALARAEALYDAGRYEQAGELAARHLADDPEDADALTLLARCQHRAGNHAAALTAVEQALRAEPELLMAHLMRTQILLGLKRYGDAEAAAHRTVELAPQFWGSHYALGTALAETAEAGRGRDPVRTGATGADAVVPFVVGAVVLVGAWAGWAVWMARRVPPRLRRPLLLVARNCRPVLAMAAAVGLLGLYSAVTLALWSFDAGVVGALGTPLFWAVVITYWVSRSALNRRMPKD